MVPPAEPRPGVPNEGRTDGAREPALREARIYLVGVRNARARPEFNLQNQCMEGDVAGTIVDCARASHADLIAMSTHGYSGAAHWAMGSNTEKVLRGAPCPVLVVRSHHPIQNVLITLDGSPLAERALAPALEATLSLGGQARLLCVVPPLEAMEIVNIEMNEPGRTVNLEEELTQTAKDYLAQLAAQLARGLDLRTDVAHGPPAQTILEFAETHNIDLIAMATHGYGGLKRWVYGSITEKVMRHAYCSLLIVRSAV